MFESFSILSEHIRQSHTGIKPSDRLYCSSHVFSQIEVRLSGQFDHL